MENKKLTLYKVEYWVPDANTIEYHSLDEDQLKEFKALYEKERKDYLIANLDGANDMHKWELWMRDAFEEAQITTVLISGITEVEAEIIYVDLDHPITVDAE